jgi:hypothetical protein
MLRRLFEQVKQIAEECCDELGTRGFPPHNYKERCGYLFDINEVYGRDWANNPIDGWDPVDNRPARMVAAAGNALYGFPPSIDGARGCGDCTNMYKMGLPAMSFRGSVVDYGNGRIERGLPGGRKGGHDVTESQVVPVIWAGIKHGLVFAVSYAGMIGIDAPSND